MGSLQDALLESGLASEERKRRSKSGRDRGGRGRSGSADGKGDPRRRSARTSPKRGRKSEATDLERAWAARRQAEKAEQERVKQARLADQEARRKRNLELDRIVGGRVLNADDAELPRYFEHLGRIRRVLCTAEQRDAINRGALGIVSLRGRYFIVAPDTLEQYRAVAPDLVPDLSGRESEVDAAGEYPPVPDDLSW